MMLRNRAVVLRAIAVLSISAAATAALIRRRKRVREASRARRLVRSDTRVVLVIDIGSSSVRCSAYTMGSSPSRLPGCAVQIKDMVVNQDHGAADAQKVMAMVDSAVDKCFRKLRAIKISNTVVAVGFACFGMNLVGVDADGHPCTPVFTYANSSPGSADITNRLRESLERAGHAGTHGLEEAHQRTGTPIHGSYAPVQLLQWLTRRSNEEGEEKESRSDESKPRAKVKTWTTLPSLIAARWCCLSSAPVSYSEASWMGLLDFRRLEWDAVILVVLRDLGFDCSTLPELADIGELRKGVNGAALKRWPELDGASIRLGVGDGAAACLGSGCDEVSGLMSVTIGTSAAARVVLRLESTASTETEGDRNHMMVKEGFCVPKGLWCYRLDKKRVVLGGALTDGGSVFEWVRRTLVLTHRVSSEEILREVEDMPPADHGLVILPFFSGERSPGYKDDARACILGLRRSTTRAQLVRAALESVCLRLAVIVNLIAGVDAYSDVDCVRRDSPFCSSSSLDNERANYSSPSIAVSPSRESVTSEGSSPARVGGTGVSAGAEAVTRDMAGTAAQVSQAQNDFQVVASGQALAASPLWRQILADSLGRVVRPSGTSEETSLGVAVLLSSLENEDRRRFHGSGASLEQATGHKSAARDHSPVDIHTPNRDAVLAYRAAAMEQQQAYRTIFDPVL